MKKLAVLLTVHNRKGKTLDCLERLFASLPVDGWETEVYMTDDGSTDGTREAVGQRFPEVRIVDGDGNLYWNRGMIVAWKKAVQDGDRDAYLWLNDDTVLFPESLNKILEATAKHPDAILSGATRSANSEEITYGGFDRSETLLVPDGTFRKCHTINGNIVLVPHSAFEKIGYLDHAYTHATGDVDYGLTANEKGVKVLLMPEICGICEANRKTPKWRDPEVPFHKRVRALWHPLAYTRPHEYFHYKRKHWGFGTACLAMCSIALNVTAPDLWKRIRKW